MEHHDAQALLTMARRGESSPHLSICSFCREQYEYALELLSTLSATGDAAEARDPKGDPAMRPAAYRLAAQTAEAAAPLFRLRRTWYLNNNAVILRVIEDTLRQQLTGFLIAEDERDRPQRIRFDGIEREFLPDRNGVFGIGAASIDIEPMTVTLIS